MKINTLGIKMVGLKKAAGETKCLGRGYGDYVQISYDTVNGEVLTQWHQSQNEWSQYHDKNIITIWNVGRPVTMQEIADHIHEALVGW